MTKHVKVEFKSDDGGGTLPVEIKNQFAGVMTAIAEMRQKHEDGLKEAKKGFDDVVRKDEVKRIDEAITSLKSTVEGEIAALKRLPRGGKDENKTADQIEHSKKFEEWFRTGDGERELKDLQRKALASTSDQEPAGGYTVRPEMDTAIDEVLKEVSPIRALATVRTVSTNSFDKLVNQHGVNSGWVGETDSRPQTLAPDLTKLSFPTMELYAMPAASQTLLDDASINIDQWIADEVSLEFAQKEGAAFVSGTGVNQPRGFLGYTNVLNSSYAWGSVGYTKTGNASSFAASNPADTLLDLMFSLKAAYRTNAQFIMNRSVMGAVRKFKDGQGNYLADLRLRDGALVESIFGKTVNEAEDMPNLGANTFPIAYADFRRAYLIIDRIGVRVLRDPYMSKPYVLFYTTKRVGGGIQNFEAIKLVKCEA